MNEKKKLRHVSTANSILVLLFIILVMLFSIAISFIIEAVIPETNTYKYSIYSLIVNIMQYLVVVPFVIAVYRKITKSSIENNFTAIFKKSEVKVSIVLKWIVISLSLIYIASFLSNMLLTVIKGITNNAVSEISLAAEPNLVGMLSNVIGMLLLAPLFEEILFRGIFFKGVERYGSWFAIIITGVTFGMWHINIGQTLYTIVLGICTSFLLAKTKSIIPCIVLHGIFNLIGTIESLIMSGIDLDKSDNMKYMIEHIPQFLATGIMGLIVFVIIITGFILLIIEICRHKETFQFHDTECSFNTGRKIAIYFTSPITVILYIVLIVFTVYNALSV